MELAHPSLRQESQNAVRDEDLAIVRALAGWLSVTESAVTMQSWVGSCEVTATPASIAPLVVSVTVEPATGTHAWPSLELYAVNVLLERPTARYAGTLPAIVACSTALTPVVARYWTTRPLMGVTSKA